MEASRFIGRCKDKELRMNMKCMRERRREGKKAGGSAGCAHASPRRLRAAFTGHH